MTKFAEDLIWAKLPSTLARGKAFGVEWRNWLACLGITSRCVQITNGYSHRSLRPEPEINIASWLSFYNRKNGTYCYWVYFMKENAYEANLFKVRFE